MLQVTEILDNAIDEVQAGHASNVQVMLVQLVSNNISKEWQHYIVVAHTAMPYR